MRLSKVEIDTILKSVYKIDRDAEVYLFGSRTDDKSKGGDIDLVIVSKAIDFSKKREIRLAITKVIGEQKIDVVVTPTKGDKASAFVRKALREGIRL